MIFHGRETVAFADAFEMNSTIKKDMEQTMSKQMPIVMLTNALSLFDVINKPTLTTEKLLMT